MTEDEIAALCGGKKAIKRVARANKDAAASNDRAFNNWVVIRDPGCVPDLKGPFRPVQVAPFLREVFECRPRSFVEVLTVTHGGIVSVQDGPECLEMTDGRSAPIARKHRARLSASLLDGLGEKIVQKRACIEGAVTAEGDEHKSGGAA